LVDCETIRTDSNQNDHMALASVATVPHLLTDKDLAKFQGQAKPVWHNLQQAWTFHYLIPNRMGLQNANWADFLKELHDFQTFEDFYAILNTIDPPSSLPKGCRYYVFRKGVQPLWEDEGNLNGKEIFAQYPSDPKQGKTVLKAHAEEAERHWRELTLSVIANPRSDPLLRHQAKINGVEYNCRGSVVKVGIWTAPLDAVEFDEIKEDVKNILGGQVTLKDNDIHLGQPSPQQQHK
jgi:translation initiation factor 4E